MFEAYSLCVLRLRTGQTRKRCLIPGMGTREGKIGKLHSSSSSFSSSSYRSSARFRFVFYPVLFLQALIWLSAVRQFFVLSKGKTLRSSSSHLRLPSALQPSVGFGLSNNVLPFFPICHQLCPSSHSQHLKISFYFLFPSFPGSSPSSRPFQFLCEDLFGHPILLHSL